MFTNDVTYGLHACMQWARLYGSAGTPARECVAMNGHMGERFVRGGVGLIDKGENPTH